MASKRRQRRRRCERKKPLTQAEAQRVASIMNAKNQGSVTPRVDAYRCPVDPSHWHVGRRPKRVQQSINSRRYGARKHTRE